MAEVAGSLVFPDVTPRVELPAEEPAARARTRRLVVRATAVMRIFQITPWPVAVLLGERAGYAHPWLAAASYVVQGGWGVTFVVLMLRRRMVDQWMVGVDAGVAVTCLIVAGLACDPSGVTSWSNSAIAPAMGAAMATAIFWPFRRAALAGAAIVAGYAIGVAHGVNATPSALPSAVGNVVSLTGFVVVGAMIAHFLFREADRVDAATREMVLARERTATERGRYDERTRQYRLLHDTVLSTLSSIARGGLDYRTHLVRERCAADADYLRGLISVGEDRTPTELSAELAAVGRQQAALGTRVHHLASDIPAGLPTEVVRALADAVREALNNVAKHAGSNEAWVTAIGTPECGITVTVVDRGVGFDPATVSSGLGVSQSIADRMREVGGSSSVDSASGQGTSVELTWPA